METVFPDDFDLWPAPSRWLVRTLARLPSWQAHGFALVDDEQLAEWRQCDPRTVRRMRAEATRRGAVERVFVRRGQPLPDGTRTRRGLWVLRAGPSLLRTPMGRDEPSAPAAPHVAPLEAPPVQTVLPDRRFCPPQPDRVSADRSVDRPEDERSINASRSTSLRSMGSTREGAPAESRESSNAEDVRAAHAVAHHYARATGRRWRTVHAEVLAFILRFLEEMVGSADGKIERVCKVIDRVVEDAALGGRPKPTLRFVFGGPHPGLFWRRLEQLDHPPPEYAAASFAPASFERAPAAPDEELSAALAEFRALARSHAA
jgi:hypothetical protein